jgi:hypothetical protein
MKSIWSGIFKKDIKHDAKNNFPIFLEAFE